MEAKTVRVSIDLDSPSSRPMGRIDPEIVDAATEAQLTEQAAADEAEARRDAAAFLTKRAKKI